MKIQDFIDQALKAQSEGATEIQITDTELLFVKTEPQKRFVNRHTNKCELYLQDHINVGDNLIIIDGSFMKDEFNNNCFGIDFHNGDNYELFIVVETNKPFPTNTKEGKSLSHINNCKIQGFDGKIYYCSKINLIRYK